MEVCPGWVGEGEAYEGCWAAGRGASHRHNEHYDPNVHSDCKLTARKARARGSKQCESRTSCFFAWPFPLSRDRARQIATASFVMAGALVALANFGILDEFRSGVESKGLDEHDTLEHVTSALVIGQFMFEASLSIQLTTFG